MRGLGSENIDFRLRHADFAHAADGDRAWLGMLDRRRCRSCKRVLVIGSFLRKDHPLFAQRLRAGRAQGRARCTASTPCDDDWLMPMRRQQIAVAPSGWVAGAGRRRGRDRRRARASPRRRDGNGDRRAPRRSPQSLLGGERKAILLGNAAAQHPQAAALLALANWIGEQTGASVGYLTEAANTVGAQLVGALPGDGGLNAGQMLGAAAAEGRAAAQRRAGARLPPTGARPRAALAQAEMVVALSAVQDAAWTYADVLLPIAPFTETPGTFVNAEGRAQSFHGVVKPLGETRPAWKVLRVLGNLLACRASTTRRREEVLRRSARRRATRSPRSSSNARRGSRRRAGAAAGGAGKLERIADVPIYSADPLVRRAPSLQLTADARAPQASLPARCARARLAAGDRCASPGQGTPC